MSSARAVLRAFYLDTAGGPRFCLHHSPEAPQHGASRPTAGAIVYVHPFAEEMNKSRRMAACSARHFATLGFEVLQIDLHGCGDSPGDFGDATWTGWVADIRAAVQWLRERCRVEPALWGLRAGCLLALEASRAEVAEGAAPAPLLLWQPPASGKVLAQQFLRLRIAADALRQTTDPFAATPAAGALATAEPARAESPPGPGGDAPTEVAGYLLDPQLLAGFRNSSMQPLPRPTTSAWFEVSSREPCELLPATTRTVAQWRDAGHAVHAQAVAGPGFWQTQEINVVSGLIDASARWLHDVAAGGGSRA